MAETNSNALLTELRALLTLVDRQANKLDNFLEEGSSSLNETRTQQALMAQTLASNTKHINDHCELFHKGDTSFKSQLIVARQEVKELMLAVGRLSATIEQINAKVTIDSEKISELKAEVKIITDKPKNLRDNAGAIAQWVVIAIMCITWIWDKVHK